MVLPAEGERDGDEPDHGCDEREEPRLCHAAIEELDPDEGIVEKPQVVVPREKQGEADESARRIAADFFSIASISGQLPWLSYGFPLARVGQ